MVGGLITAGAALRWSADDASNDSPSNGGAHRSTRPSDGEAQCLDPAGDVLWRTGRGTNSTIQTSNGRAVDITGVSVTVTGNTLHLRLDLFSAPFEYPHGTLYAYDMSLYRPGSGDASTRSLYTMLVGSDGIGNPGSPTETRVLNGPDGQIKTAKFDISGEHIAMTVPLADVDKLGSRFEFSAHANFAVPFADTPNPGLWDDSCPTAADAEGSMKDITLPKFPMSDAPDPGHAPTSGPTTSAATTTTPTRPSATTTAPETRAGFDFNDQENVARAGAVVTWTWGVTAEGYPTNDLYAPTAASPMESAVLGPEARNAGCTQIVADITPLGASMADNNRYVFNITLTLSCPPEATDYEGAPIDTSERELTVAIDTARKPGGGWWVTNAQLDPDPIENGDLGDD